MTPDTIRRALVTACLLALVALTLIVWSLLDPRPLQVVGAMSVGQALGMASLGLYVYAALTDVGRELAKRS
jgi:hypothetical protein